MSSQLGKTNIVGNWTEYEDLVLREGWRSSDISIPGIGAKLDRSVDSIRARARTLRLGKKTHSTKEAWEPRPNSDALSAHRGASVDVDRDAAYVARCIALGGFWAFSERRTARGQVFVCLPVVPGRAA